MQRADQRAVVQKANLTLATIRNAEVVYFNGFYLNFGTQAAVINAALCGSLSQCPALQADCAYVWKFIYFVGAAMVVAIATHILLCAIFITVYGQGLAIRGPPGSMVKAIDGMVEEQRHVTFAFVLLIFFFVVMQQVGMFFAVMHEVYAIISSVFLVLALSVTYHYALRIYNRFYWDKSKTGWNDITFLDPDEQLNELDPHADDIWRTAGRTSSKSKDNKHRKQKKSLFHKLGFKRGSDTGADDSGADAPAGDAPAGSAVRNPLNNYSSPYYDNASSLSDSPYLDISHIDKDTDTLRSTIAGYMTVKMRRSLTQLEPWVRRYFVVRGNLIYYYKDQHAFKTDASKPINRRPIDLEGYSLIAGASEPPYVITLLPLDPTDIRKAWRFRCDTLTEFRNWVDMFAAALKATAASSSGGSGGAVGGRDQQGTDGSTLIHIPHVDEQLGDEEDYSEMPHEEYDL